MKTKPLTVLIVDDEPEARDLLCMLLERLEGIEIAGTAEGVDQAVKMTMDKRPDLILLDIQMPGKGGFELVRMIHKYRIPAGIIFVTAFDEYAIEAVRVSAFDYLLKPVDPEALEKAVDRYRNVLPENDLLFKIRGMIQSLNGPERIKVNTRSGFILIDLQELVYCQADGNYTRIYLDKGKEEVITLNLGGFTERLDPKKYFRISRSSIINLDYLERVDNKSGTCRLRTVPPVHLKVARSNRDHLERICSDMA